jgi:hypothetical protein
MTGLTDPKEEDSAVTANGTISTPNKMGKLNVVACDNQGYEKSKASFQEVAYCPDAPLNAVSITYLCANGWRIVSGDNRHLKLEDEHGNKMVFNIIIRTKKGMLYAAYLKRVTATETGMIVAAELNNNETTMKQQ